MTDMQTDIHDTTALVSKALRKAWRLGQTYWQQENSAYPSQWKKADATQDVKAAAESWARALFS